MQFILMTLFAVVIAAVDQLTKYLTVANIPLHGYAPAVDGVFHFTYLRNTGAAFSSFQGMRWLFILIFAAITVAVIYEYFRSPMPFSTFDRWCIAAIYGGGLGNMIDRVFLGYVVDMVQVEFIRFPVFNLADCFICCGCFLLILHLVFFNKDFWKEEKK